MAENNDNRTLKAIVKCRNHPSNLVIASEYKNRANFSFNFVSNEDVLTEIKVLDVSKGLQERYIPVKIIKAYKNLLCRSNLFLF